MSLPVENFTIVYFATRSLGYGRNGDILQLAVRFGHGKTYSVWIKPTRVTAKYASEIEGLEIRGGELFFKNKRQPTVSLADAMHELFVFLKSSTKPVVIVSHAAQFASVLLLQAILQTDTVDEFNSVIASFSDSLPIIIEKFPRRKGRGAYELPVLAHDLLKETHTKESFDASLGLDVLEKLITRYNLKDRIIQKSKSFEEALLSEMVGQYGCKMVQGLEPLRVAITIGTMKKIAAAGVSFSALKEVFQQKGSEGLRKFLSDTQPNGKPLVTETPEILQKITQFFEVGTTSQSSNANQPIYSYVDPLKKLQDRINREIDFLRRKQGQAYEDVDLLRTNSTYEADVPESESMYAETYSNEDRIDREVELRKKPEPNYVYVGSLQPNTESMYAKTYEDRIDPEVELRKKPEPNYVYVGSLQPNTESMYAKTYEDRINRESELGKNQEHSYEYVGSLRPNTESMYAKTYEDRINRESELGKNQEDIYEYVDALRPNTESMYAETYSDADRINREIELKKKQGHGYEYVDSMRPNTESMYAETYSDADRINREIELKKKQGHGYEYVDSMRPNTESMYAETYSDEFNVPSYSHIDPLKKQQDRINRENDPLRNKPEPIYANVDLLRKNPESTYEKIDSKEDNASNYSYIDRLKKQQDRINREIDLLKQKQEQSYANVDQLRANLTSNYKGVRRESDLLKENPEPIYEELPSKEEAQKQVGDDTVQLRQKRVSETPETVELRDKRLSGNYSTDALQKKRRAVYLQKKRN